MESFEALSKIATGVPGLDHILLGGFLREGFYLIQGEPGSGKTTLALQFLLHRLREGDRCLYITLTETRRDLENTCRSHAWSWDGLPICDLTKSAANMTGAPESSVFHPSETELGETTQAIFDAIEKHDPQCVVFDGLSEMRLLSGSPLLYRRQLLALKEYFVERRITAVLLDDGSSPFGTMPPESLMGGSVVLERMHPAYGRARRRLFVAKVRGSNFRDGYHDYDIVPGGVVVHPRLISFENHYDFKKACMASTIVNLDKMLGGGLTPGSTTILMGPAGAGKSTVAMQFVLSAIEDGKKASVFLFDEMKSTLFDRAEKLCGKTRGGIRSHVESGSLSVQQVDPAEMSPGEFAHEVRKSVESGAKVVVIDSMNGYLNAMPEERLLTVHLHELFSFLNQKGIVTLMVVAQHGMIAASRTGGDVDVSYLADTVLLFRYFEAYGEIHKAISVFKKRTGSHERSIRELEITSEGIFVGKPLREFRGIMTGVPQYEGRMQVMEQANKDDVRSDGTSGSQSE